MLFRAGLGRLIIGWLGYYVILFEADALMSSLGDLLRRIWGSPDPNPIPKPAPPPSRRAPGMADPGDRTVVSAARHPTQSATRSRSAPHSPAPPTAQVTRQVRPTEPQRANHRAANSGDTTMIASSRGDAKQYLERVQVKINKLAEEFASGSINRDQFQQLFDHYQRERNSIQNWMNTAALSDDWKDISNEGKSIVIRTKHTAKVLGYAIYENEFGMPLNTIGDFEIDPALAVPMLSSYRAATKEIFGGEMRSTQIEGGKWLCFVPGRATTMLALFNTEPAGRQLEIMEDLHRLFEQANRRHLVQRPIDIDQLAFPHTSFLGRLQ